jgi:Radical SAM superfamily
LTSLFLDYCIDTIAWEKYAVVGFTSTFEQNIASLALAGRIKAAHPRIAVVFGGANWEGEMGHELHRQFRFVDYVCSGEADLSFPALLQCILAGGSVRLYYEVKANLTRRQVQILQEAGVDRIQPGIESLSDHVLRLMHKGTTALRNIQLLKWCKECSVGVDWNILYGFPGETREDYDGILELLAAIRFLGPACAHGPVRMDRFSPFYDKAGEFGLTNVRPLAPYKYLYPFDDQSVSRIAYCFDFDYEPGADPTSHAARVVEYIEAWRREPEMGTLSSVLRPDDTLALVDTRSNATQPEFMLSGMEKSAYEYCDALRSGVAVTRFLRRAFPDAQFTEQQVLGFLDSLVENRLMVTDGIHYLSLAISAKLEEPPAACAVLVPVAQTYRDSELAGSHFLQEPRALPSQSDTVRD